MEMEMGLATGRASINSEAPDDLACCSTMAGVSTTVGSIYQLDQEGDPGVEQLP